MGVNSRMRLMDNREIIAAILTAGMLPTLPVPGRIRPASAGTTSRPANRSRTEQNGFVESFNGRLRDEQLNETLIKSLPQARAVLVAWRRDYNEQRPHSKLGWMTPEAYASTLSGENGRDAALRWGSAPRPLATHQTEGSNQPRTRVIPG